MYNFLARVRPILWKGILNLIKTHKYPKLGYLDVKGLLEILKKQWQKYLLFNWDTIQMYYRHFWMRLLIYLDECTYFQMNT